nr:hypothetical protein [Kiritimatiellia bacterium]
IAGGTNLTFTGTGSVAIVASQAGNTNWNPAPEVTNTFNVAKAAQAALGFAPESPQTYNTTNTLSATGGSGTGAVSYAVQSGPGEIVGGNGLKMLAGTGAVTVVATKAADDLYLGAAATGQVAAAKAGQAITFPAIGDKIATNTVGLAATASSGLGVSFAVGSGPASIAGGTNLTFTGSGAVSIVASQAGNAHWNPAPNVTNTLNVIKAPQTITFPAISAKITTNTVGLAATASSGLGVSFSVLSGAASISGGTNLSFTGTGVVKIVASQAGNAIYSAAPNKTNSFNVAKATQAPLWFSPVSPQTYDTTVFLSASGGSGTGAISYAVASGPGEVADGNGLKMLAGTGTVVVVATRAADALYLAAAATGTVAAAKAGQTIIFPAISDQWVTNKMGLAATASSDRPVSFVVGGPATLADGTNLTLTGAGTVTIVASQAGDANWNAAASVTNAFRSLTAGVDDIAAAQLPDGMGRVRIDYTLRIYPTSGVADVAMAYSTNAGWSWTALGAGAVTGDCGAAIGPGARWAIWDAPQQLSSNTLGNNHAVRITATAGGETATNYSDLFLVDLKDLNGGLRVYGIVKDSHGALLSGATVALAGTTGVTVNGAYSLPNVAIIRGNTLAAGKFGYVSHAQSLSVPVGCVEIAARDIRLGSNLVTSLDPSLQGLFLYLPGYDVMNCEYKATVNWQGLTPSSVSFNANGTMVTTITTHAVGPDGTAEYTCTMNMGSDNFRPSLIPLANSVGVRAAALDGGTTVTHDFGRSVTIIPLHPCFKWVFDNLSLLWPDVSPPQGLGGMILLENILIPPASKAIKVSLPIPKPIGPLGISLGASLRIGYDVASGAYEIGLGAGASKDRGDAGTRTLATFQNPLFANAIRNPLSKVNLQGTQPGTSELIIGNNKIDIFIQAVAMGFASPARGLTLDAVAAKMGLDARLLLCYVTLGGVVPAQAGNVLGSGITALAVGIYATLGINVNVVFDVTPEFRFKTANGTLKVGLQAAYEPSFFNEQLRLRIYLGGEVSAGVQYPPLNWYNCAVRAYAGGEIKIGWFFWLPVGPITLWEYPAPGPSKLSRLKMTDIGPPRVMTRDYLARGGEVFVASDEAIRKRSGLKRGEPTPLDDFRAMGQAPVQGSVMARKGAKPSRLAKAQASLEIIENSFPDSTPALAGISSNLMLLYVADNETTNDLQYTDIRWSRYDGWNWSAPTSMATDTRAEFSPQVVFDGNGDALALWERVGDPDFTNADPTALAAEMEIAWSKWDHATGLWADPMTLTTNTWLDHVPLLAGPLQDGDLLATWAVNPSNYLVGVETSWTQSDTIVWSRWSAAGQEWSSPEVLVSNLDRANSMSLSAGSNRAVFAWSADADGDLLDETDQEILVLVWTNGTWSDPLRCTSNGLADKNVRVAVSPAGDVHMVWQQESNLVSSLNFATDTKLVRPDSAGLGFGDFAMTYGPQGNLVLLWQEMTTNGSDAHVTVYDPASDTWSKDITLFNNAALERSFAPVWDNVGNLTVAYNVVDIYTTNVEVQSEGGDWVTVSNVPQPGAVSVSVTKRALITDVAIQSNEFTVAGANFLPGDVLTLSAILRNVGDIAVTNAEVAFYNGDPAAGGVRIATVGHEGWLEGAATTSVLSADWVVPEPGTNLVFTAVANPDRLFTEFSENNNTQVVAAGGSDLSVTLRQADAETNGALRVFAAVQNLGDPVPTHTVLAIRREGNTNEPLATVEVLPLDPGQSVEVVFDLPAGTQPEGESAYTMNTDETQLVLDFETNNNFASFSVNLWLDGDEDGMPNGWEDDHGLDPDDPDDAGGDEDGDGIPNYDEWRSGTDPNDDTSYLSATALIPPGGEASGAGFLLTWGSESNRLYTIRRAASLVRGAGFAPISEHIEATPPENTYLDSMVGTNGQVFFYRIDVE